MADYEILRLGHHGDGIAEGPLYAPLTLPGEIVSGTADADRLRDLRILTPSEHRVKPPCRHFKSCGGCSLQHASDDFVAGWKRDVVAQALTAQGIETDLRATVTSPAQSRRRATFAARRTKKGATAGFHQRQSDVIVEIPDCQLLHPDLMPALEIARGLAEIGASRKGALSVTATLSGEGIDLAVSGGKEADGAFMATLGQEAQRHGLARLTWNGEVIATRMPPWQPFGKARVVPPPGAFLQATREGEAALLTAVRESLTDAPADRIIDLFAGSGTFSLPLAEQAPVHAVEGSRAMVKALEAGWRQAQGLKRVTVEARDLFRNPIIPEDLRYGAAVIDPPRAGAEAQIAELAQSDVPVVAHVSCNPVTFARDAVTLIKGGYRLAWVQVVDQFRWSSHIELVGHFTRV